MFTVEGKIRGRPVKLTWKDGGLDGEAMQVFKAKFLIAEMEFFKEVVGPVGGPYFNKNYLATDLSALYALVGLMDDPRDVKVSGDVPKTPKVPKDSNA